MKLACTWIKAGKATGIEDINALMDDIRAAVNAYVKEQGKKLEDYRFEPLLEQIAPDEARITMKAYEIIVH